PPRVSNLPGRHCGRPPPSRFGPCHQTTRAPSAPPPVFPGGFPACPRPLRGSMPPADAAGSGWKPRREKADAHREARSRAKEGAPTGPRRKRPPRTCPPPPPPPPPWPPECEQTPPPPSQKSGPRAEPPPPPANHAAQANTKTTATTRAAPPPPPPPAVAPGKD